VNAGPCATSSPTSSAHEELGWLGLAGAFVRGGFGPGRVNALRLHAYRHHRPEDLVQILRDHLKPRGLTAGFGGGIGLTDSLIHQQDIRRAIGIAREVPGDRLVEALDISLRAPTLSSKKNAAGLRLAPDDLDWRHGEGPQLTGPGEAVLMACAGRSDALADLDGPGLETLRARVTGFALLSGL